ncbi:MAG: hypothetical protein HKO66_15140 [Saprospiraceae bacterium]|nr:hypothetical protein [Bacteroidia bacterium]NNE13608.1 hypothetical protein [Saprospiraceae bacterium]NNL93575.1 hypothetical protein [Saprospiraceae bacterium]
MQLYDKILLTIHITVGVISLITFMIPMFVRKGGNIHIKIGKVYIYCMWIVVCSAFLLSINNLILKHYVAAVFLGYLTLITANPLWYGYSILKYKKDVPTSFLEKKKIFDIVVVLGAIGNLIYFYYLGGKGQSILLLIFGIIGLTNMPSVIAPINKLKSKSNWYLDHMEGMIITGIAAYTAFFAFGGATFFGKIFSGSMMAIPWILPSILGAITIKYFKVKYLRKINTKGITTTN